MDIDERMCLSPGAMLQGGKYRIESILGQGGFGITYLATQVSLGRKVAIKEFFMKEHCNRDADTSHVSVPSIGSRELVEKFKVKFMKEAQMISEYRHPNIVNIHDVFEENGTAYYVMEYHDGGSLSSLDLPLSVEQASGYIRQIESALSVLHENKTMHLDIKPSNVLLDKSGNEYEMPNGYDFVSYSDGVILLERNGRYGYYSVDGYWIVQPVYTYAQPFVEGIGVIGYEGGVVGAVDTEGNVVIPFEYKTITNSSSGVFACYSEQNGWKVLAKVDK